MEKELYILWTNDNLITTEKMVFMYGHNCILKNWWDKVTIIVWGAPAKLIADNQGVQEQICSMISDGVHFSACKSCADQLGVSSFLEELGIEVKYWGEPLTELIQTGKKLITI